MSINSSTVPAALSLHVKPYAEGAANAYKTESRSRLTRFVNIACALGKAYVHHSAVKPGNNHATLTCEVSDVATAVWNMTPEALRSEKGDTKADGITYESIKQYTTYCNGLIREGSSKYNEKIALACRKGDVPAAMKAFDEAGLGSVKAVQSYLYPPKGGNDGGKARKPFEKVASFVKGLDLKPNALAQAIVRGLSDEQRTALVALLAKAKAKA